MHRDEGGRPHFSVALWGPWSHSLAYDMDWLFNAPPPKYRRSRKVVDAENVWYLEVQLSLPSEGKRAEPMELHFSAMTGAVWSRTLGQALVERADGVVFVADTTAFRLEATLEAHRLMRSWSLH